MKEMLLDVMRPSQDGRRPLPAAIRAPQGTGRDGRMVSNIMQPVSRATCWFVLPLVAIAALGLAVAPAAAQPVEVSVDWLYYADTPDGAIGGIERSIIRLDANDSGRLRVGFFEELPGGAGLSSRAAGWMAAIVASNILDIDLFDYTLSYETPGLSDGPSAGGLTTAGVLAALLGHSILPHATMTGTIQPDGSIGPVGGIAQKIEGAAAAGKTLVLIPFGQRMEEQVQLELEAEVAGDGGPGLEGPSSTTYIDLVEYGASLGVEVKEVANIFEAYALLTGHELRPRPRPATEEELALSPAALEAVRQRYERLRQRLLQRAAELEAEGRSLDGRVLAILQQAGEAMSAGDPPTAWNLALDAHLLAIKLQAEEETAALVGQPEEALHQQLEAWRESAGRLEGFFNEIARVEPASLGGVAAVLQAHGSAAHARGLLSLADLLAEIAWQYFPTAELIAESEEGEAILEDEEGPWHRAIHHFADAGALYRAVDLARELAWDFLAIGEVDDPASIPAPDPQRAERLGVVLRAGAMAGMEYFTRLILDSIAEEAGVHPNVVHWGLLGDDYDYALAFAGITTMAQSATGWLPFPSPWSLLGAAGDTFNDVGVLITEYYALDATKDEGVTVAVEREESLAEMLRWAEEEAAAAIAAAFDAGVVPTISQLFFQMARYEAQQSLDDQIDALGLYWQAGFLARTTTWLSREPARLGPAAAAPVAVGAGAGF